MNKKILLSLFSAAFLAASNSTVLASGNRAVPASLVKVATPLVSPQSRITTAQLQGLGNTGSLSGEDAQAARILAAALVQPGFIEGNRPALEKLFGDKLSLSDIEAKAAALAVEMAQDSDLRTAAETLQGQTAPQVAADLQAALAEAPAAFDGSARTRSATAEPAILPAEDPAMRRRFNDQVYTPQRYADLNASLIRDIDQSVDRIRIAETPVFLGKGLLNRTARAGQDIIKQLVEPGYVAAAEEAIPPSWIVRGQTSRPTFVAVDFGLVRDPSGRVEPRLVELQGFTSLYGYMGMLGRAYVDAYGLDGMKFLMGGLDWNGYVDLLKRAILGKHKAEDVVLLEITPEKQKTLMDFLVIEKLLGVKAVDVSAVKKDGRSLYYVNESGKRVDIKRLYNRVMPEEFAIKKPAMDFQFTDDLDVEWAGHPNWFFLISKFSLPYIKHATVPSTRFLHTLERLPADLTKYVVKPLWGYGGSGVMIGPTQEQVEAIPQGDRSEWVIQERMQYDPFIDTPEGQTKTELRVMYIWPEDEPEPVPVITLARLSRGDKSNVSLNKQPWLGISTVVYKP